MSLTIYTIGHSTHPIEEFIAILDAHAIRLLADIRTVPKSRHNPQFNSSELERSLAHAGIEYVHLKGLGGLRHAKKDSVNTGWKNEAFRGYADYMLTEEFEASVQELLRLAERKRAACMCAEALPGKCHRSLLSDALLVRGVQVLHLLGKAQIEEHSLTPFARVAEGTKIIYSGEQTTFPW